MPNALHVERVLSHQLRLDGRQAVRRHTRPDTGEALVGVDLDEGAAPHWKLHRLPGFQAGSMEPASRMGFNCTTRISVILMRTAGFWKARAGAARSTRQRGEEAAA